MDNVKLQILFYQNQSLFITKNIMRITVILGMITLFITIPLIIFSDENDNYVIISGIILSTYILIVISLFISRFIFDKCIERYRKLYLTNFINHINYISQ